MSTDPEVATLSILAPVGQVKGAAALRNSLGLDVVLAASTDPRHNPTTSLTGSAERFLELTGVMPELDANRYAGKSRSLGASPLDRAWCEKQVALGAPTVLTNGGYIDGDVADVKKAVSLAEDMQHVIDAPVTAMIVLSSALLRAETTALVDIFGGARVRIGLALGHQGDPLAAKSSVAALIRVLGSGNVELRRVDLSGIGGLAFGAAGAAIGTTATLRHVYPIRPSKMVPSQYPSILVEKSMSWKTQDRVMDAAATFDDDAFWTCECDTCFGRRIDSALRTEQEIIAHNSAVIVRIARKVLGSTDPVVTWMQMCISAQSYCYEIAEYGPRWEPQDFLGAWWANQPTRVG